MINELSQLLSKNQKMYSTVTIYERTQLAQRRYGNVVTTSLLTLSQRWGTVENDSYADVSIRRCHNVALRHCQETTTMLLQRPHNIKVWICRPFYYGLFYFLTLHREKRERVTKVLSGIKQTSFLFKRTLYL